MHWFALNGEPVVYLPKNEWCYADTPWCLRGADKTNPRPVLTHLEAKQSIWDINDNSSEWAFLCDAISWKHKSATWETMASVCGWVFVTKQHFSLDKKHRHPHSCELNSPLALQIHFARPSLQSKVLQSHLWRHTVVYRGYLPPPPPLIGSVPFNPLAKSKTLSAVADNGSHVAHKMLYCTKAYSFSFCWKKYCSSW